MILSTKLFRPAAFLLAISWMALWGGVAACSAQNAPAAENGVFSILSKQRQIGVEKFKMTPTANGLEITGEIQLDMPGAARISESCSLKLDDKMRPLAYDRQQKSPKKGSISAQFGTPETKLSTKTDAGAEDRVFYLPDKDLVVLDTNFFHHYSLLVRRYDPSQPGPQRWNVFIPQEAMPGAISLELQGKESEMVGKTMRELNHFQAATEEVKIDIWATPQGEIYRMSIPQANLEIVRQ